MGEKDRYGSSDELFKQLQEHNELNQDSDGCLKKFIKQMTFKGLFYLAPIENIEGILRHGILSYNEVESKGISHKKASNPEIQERRHARSIRMSDGQRRKLHDVVSFHFTPEAPDMAVMVGSGWKLVYVVIPKNTLVELINNTNITYAFSDKNLACKGSQTYTDFCQYDKIQWKYISTTELRTGEYKEERCAEFLISPRIHPKYITEVWVGDEEDVKYIRNLEGKLRKEGLPVENLSIDIRPDLLKRINRGSRFREEDHFS